MEKLVFQPRGVKYQFSFPFSVVGHLSYVQIEASLWQQRCQLKGLESIAADFSVAIEPGLAVDSLMAAFHIIQKSLG